MPACRTGICTSVPRDATATSPRMPHPDGQEKRSQEDRRCPQAPSDSAAVQRDPEKALVTPVALNQAPNNGTGPGTAPRPPNLLLQGDRRWEEEVETMEEEEDVVLADVTLVPEVDITSPPNRRLTHPETRGPTETKSVSEKFRPGISRC